MQPGSCVNQAITYLILIFLWLAFTLASTGTVIVFGVLGRAVVVVDSTVVDDGVVCIGVIVLVAGVEVVWRVVVVVVPVWALAEKAPAVSMAARMSSFFMESSVFGGKK